MQPRRFALDALGWGIALWLVGYLLSIALFAFVPTAWLGWFIMPVAVGVTLWVLLTRVSGGTLGTYVLLGVSWAALAVMLDYFFIVRLFAPADGYYKPDVYLYYLLTFALPVLVGWRKAAATP